MGLVDQHFPVGGRPDPDDYSFPDAGRCVATAKAGQALILLGVGLMGNALFIGDPAPPLHLAERLFEELVAMARRNVQRAQAAPAPAEPSAHRPA